jgi:D-beta-D-heptose 7-phosphate kinase/D-beta-D-heptose 1-phosphate adenosyltransferase
MTFDLDRFRSNRILVLGDHMLDIHLRGRADRISPEAPVPVVTLCGESRTPGGAGNAVNNLVALGAGVLAAGVLGDDAEGRLLLETFTAMGVDTSALVVQPGRQTTVKTRVIAGHQHVLRIDRDSPEPISAAAEAALLQALIDALPQVQAVLVSDYGKGSVTGGLLESAIAAAKRLSIPVVVDPKGRDVSRYKGATLLTPNRGEAALAAGIATDGSEGLHRAGSRLLELTGVPNVLVTLGKDGMLLFKRGQPPRRITGEARQVFDVTGAGDTVAATATLALAAGTAVEEAVMLANTAAGIVVSKLGTAAVSLRELKNALASEGTEDIAKLVLFPEIGTLAAELKSANRRIAFTNGCFDLLHAGHIHLLAEARKLGDVLIVAIDDDENVRRLKGPGRPVVREHERLRMIAALDAVDFVTVFSEGRLEELVGILLPDVLIKGADYRGRVIVGQDTVEKNGGRVVLVPLLEGLSSSGIIAKIRNNDSR